MTKSPECPADIIGIRKVEQTFAVLGRYRRLLIDHEGSTARSRLMTLLAALFTTANRFERQTMA